MSVFSRASDIIQSNLNAMLDKAENPQKLTRQLINEMEEAVTEARELSATMISQKKALTRELNSLTQKMARWQQKAGIALDQQREDLARAALQQKQQLAPQYESLTSQLKQTEASIDKLDEQIGQLKCNIGQAQKKVRPTQPSPVTSADQSAEIVSTTCQQLTRYESKLKQLESRYDNINEAGKQNTLHAEFARLEADQNIDMQLAALKQQRSA
ncbi:PspA/IM30 family protein [Salinimonas lutimaris]|uniref:PspA/IM30 family protein n=1 Tax=Salinimonas lutimaris TaxID=914153 RepID=UPI0010C0E68F|nr:PspA/IM30 family protein [Salinimonas lutimaris]